MREKEQKLWDRMRHCLKDRIYMERIENVVNPGRPDVDLMLDGVVVPIELKALTGWPVRAETPVLGCKGLNQNQLNWWLTWKSWGGLGFIVVGIGLDLFVIPHQFSDELNLMNRARLCEFKTSWTDFLEIVKGDVKCLRNQ